MKKIFSIIGLALWLLLPPADAQTGTAERGKLFADGNYSMFIHWGAYAHFGNQWKGKTYYGIGEWLMNKGMAGIPVAEYMEAAKAFNPVEFDADAVAQLAKDAGMKYIVITSKHHEGFAMFHSKANSFNIVDATPFGRDPIKELAEACRRHGIGLGLYYSHFKDWTYPGAGSGPSTDADGNPKTFDDYYREKCLPQVEEITSNYGDLQVVWFDTPGSIPREKAEELVSVVRRNQPNALVSGRVGHGLGDYQSFGDMELPLRNIDGLWESIDTMNDSWAYAWYDNNWKTPKAVLQLLLSTVARGGTCMLNVGLDGLGRVPEAAQLSLRSAGKWIARYPQVVYATDASPWQHVLPWGEVIMKGRKMFLVVYEWPRSGALWLHGLPTGVKKAVALQGNKRESVKVSQQDGWTCIAVPAKAPDTPVAVVELQLTEENPQVDTAYFVDPEIGLQMTTMLAETRGCHAVKKTWREKFGEWKHTYSVHDWKPGASVTWDFYIKDAGYYHIDLTYSGKGRVVWKATTDEGTFIQNQQNSSEVYHTYPIGWLKFDKPGHHTVTVELLEGEPTASLTQLVVTPVDLE